MKSRHLILVLTVLLSAGLAVGLAAVLAAPNTITFAPRVDYTTGINPDLPAVGYFNGDANPDIAIPSRSSSTVTILLGDGAGGFSYGTTSTVEQPPRAVATDDFNGDSKADLAVAHYSAGMVSILLGDGAGAFSQQATMTVGSGPWSLAADDLNGDGNADLVTANVGSDNVSILAGDGTGGFSYGTTVTVGNGPSGVTIGNLNSDANADIVVANQFAGDNVSILLGDGAGGFSRGTTMTAGTDPIGSAVGDLDDDGDTDIAVANYGSDNVTILLSDGAGGYSYGTTLAAGNYAYMVASDDLDGDGNPDLAVPSTDAVTILRGDGDGGFSHETTLSIPNAPCNLAIADFDGDWRPDLVVTQFGGSAASILLNTSVFPSSLDLAASRSLVNYGGATMLQGSLMSDWRIIDGRDDVQVWRKSSFDTSWRRDGTAVYNPATGQYDALRALTSNTRFRMVFLGDGVFRPVTSADVLVQARASLSQPALAPTSPRRNTNFTATGTLRPRHISAGSTRLCFYRKVLGRWRFYKASTAALANLPAYTRYSLTTKLPYAGSWYAKAYHSDSSHAATWSSPRYFTVRP